MSRYDKMKNHDYNAKKQTSINLSEDILTFLRYLKEKGYVTSVSEAVRQMLLFAFPFYFQTIRIIKDAPKGKIELFIFKVPTKPTLAELRELYPKIPDYCFINE